MWIHEEMHQEFSGTRGQPSDTAARWSASLEQILSVWPSEDTSPASTLILDFQPPGLWENKFLSGKSPRLWYFVMDALEIQYRLSEEFQSSSHEGRKGTQPAVLTNGSIYERFTSSTTRDSLKPSSILINQFLMKDIFVLYSEANYKCLVSKSSPKSLTRERKRNESVW